MRPEPATPDRLRFGGAERKRGDDVLIMTAGVSQCQHRVLPRTAADRLG